MAYGDGKYQSFARVRRDKNGRALDIRKEVYVPHSQWREEVARRGNGATYAASYDAEDQARAASHKLNLPREEMLAWQRDPKNIAKFEDLAIIQYLIPITKATS